MQKLLELTSKDILKGLASGPFLSDGIFTEISGVDILQKKEYYGLLVPSYERTELTGTVVKDEIKWFVKRFSNAIDYYGFGNDGYLYKTTDPIGATTTALNSGGESTRTGARGLTIYNDILHYFSDTKIGTYDFGTAFNNTAYTGLQNAPHPAKVIDNKIIFGNGKYVGILDGTTLNATRLEFGTGYEVQDIEMYNTYAVILMSNGFHSIIYLWDLYSDYATYQFELYEHCTALEKYKETFAVFGENVYSFDEGEFEIICSIDNSVFAGATDYKQNMLYWVDENVRSYGTPTKGVKPKLFSPFSIVGTCNAFILTYPLGHSDRTMLLCSLSTKRLFSYESGAIAGSVKTIKFDIGYANIQKIILYVDNFANTDDEIQVDYYTDDESSYVNFNYNTLGERGVLAEQIVTTPTNKVYLTLSFHSGSPRIKKLQIYGEQIKPI